MDEPADVKPLPRTESATSSDSDTSSDDPTRSDAAIAVATLLDSLSPSEAVNSLTKLTRIAADASSAQPLAAAGAVAAVSLTMRSFTVPAVAYRGLSAFRAFSVAPTLRSEVLRAGGLELTLALMKSDGSLTVQDRGATIIANLAVGCPHRKRRLAREGAIAAVVRAMGAFPSDVQMQVRGALALRNLAHNAQVNQYIAAKAGAVDAVLDALLCLGRASADPELLYQTIAALESMCTQDKGNRARVVERDARAWATKESAPTDVDVPKRPPLAAAMDRSKSAGNAADTSPVSSGHGDDDAFGATPEPSSCPDGLSLDKQGASSFVRRARMLDEPTRNENLSPAPRPEEGEPAEPKSSTPPSSAGGPPPPPPPVAAPAAPAPASVFKVVLKAVKRAPENRGLLKYALSLLALTAWKRAGVQLRLGELGAVEVALATVKRYGRDVPLVTRACTLLCTLCLQQENRGRVRPGLGTLLRALDANAESVPATREIAAAISNALYCAPANRSAVLARSGARAVAQAIMRVGAKDVRVLEAGLCTLRNVVDGSRDGAERCSAEGGIDAARSAMDVTKEASTDVERRVQTQAVLLLGDMAKAAPDTMREMNRLEVADWVENALAKLERKDHREAHVVGDELLETLSEPVDVFPKTSDAAVSEIDDKQSFSFSKRWQNTRSLFSMSMPLRPNKERSMSRFWPFRRSTRKTEPRQEVFFGRRWPLGCGT